ncbi:MAG: hypothetical protein ABI591_14965 [Kofleriaceae bacterium]
MRSANRFWWHVGVATAVIMLGCWLCSGTMAPYGTHTLGDCHYRVNGDHEQFSGVFAMLDGQPAVEWRDSVVLRRILHPLLAYPLMKIFGFWAGGLMFNLLLHGGAMLALALALRRFYDARAAVLACWLFAAYPGYAYWAGLPYSYALIVPGSIACTIGLLWWHERPSLARVAIAATIIGVVGCGYDIMPFFGGALLLLTAHRRRWRDLGVSVVVLGVWAVFVARGLPAIFGFPATNSNTQTYGNVIGAWLHFWQRTDGWGAVLAEAPHVLVSNFLFSGMIFFPILFLLVVAHHLKFRVRPILGPVALAILLSTFAVFLFLNLAPPYGGAWQLRGTWLARLYQPWFVVVLLVVAAASVALRDTRRHKVLVAAVIACCLIDGVAIAGPYIHVYGVYMTVNENFYQHPSLKKNWSWLHHLGVRPYGICK